MYPLKEKSTEIKWQKYIQEDAYVGTLSLKQTLNPSGLLCVIVSLVEELALHL